MQFTNDTCRGRETKGDTYRERQRACLAKEFLMRWLANQSQGNCHVRSEHEGFLVAQNSCSNIVYNTDDDWEVGGTDWYTRATTYFLMRAISCAPVCSNGFKDGWSERRKEGPVLWFVAGKSTPLKRVATTTRITIITRKTDRASKPRLCCQVLFAEYIAPAYGTCRKRGYASATVGKLLKDCYVIWKIEIIGSEDNEK